MNIGEVFSALQIAATDACKKHEHSEVWYRPIDWTGRRGITVIVPAVGWALTARFVAERLINGDIVPYMPSHAELLAQNWVKCDL